MPSASDLTIRPATARDFDAVARLNAEVQQLHADALPHLFKPVSPESFPRPRFEHMLGQEGCHLRVAVADGPVAYLLAELVEPPQTHARFAQRVLRIHEVSVAADFRGRGCGSALLQDAQSLAESSGVTRLDLDTWWFNEHARGFFKAAGFRELNVRLASDCSPGRR
jgi:ribosomal protein S18 acetylase RimI-like enzyme